DSMSNQIDRDAQGRSDASPPAGVRRPPLWSLILITALSPFALQVLVPAMPGLVDDFGSSRGVVGFSLTGYLLGMAVGQLACGPLSDRYGRRPVLFGGLVVFFVGSVFCLVATDIWPLIAGRVLQALGASAGMVLSRAIVRDLYDRERAAQMIAYITAGMIVAPMAGPVVGGYLYELFGWQSVFWFVMAFGAVVTAACIAFVHETHFDRGVTTSMGELWQGFGFLLRMRRFRGYALQVAFTTASFYSFLGGASAVTVDIFGQSASDYGWWFVMISGSYMTGNFISGRIGMRVSSDKMITLGTTLSMTFAFALLVVTLSGSLTLPVFFLLSGVMSIGNGFSMPNGFAGAVSVDPTRAGTASGLSGALQTAIGALLLTVVGYTLADSPLPVVLMMLTGSVLAWFAHRHGMRRR
ncbi:MAG: multidrug effflux MFS transporter, partial [Rhodospirillaceae bacterium]|nr:multidrug effflux MFS transporter [Rhodospirillaceae bacterium]